MSDYGNFLSARFANEEGTAVEIQTEHMGSVLLHKGSEAASWIQLAQSKLDIEPYIENPGAATPVEEDGFDVIT